MVVRLTYFILIIVLRGLVSSPIVRATKLRHVSPAIATFQAVDPPMLIKVVHVQPWFHAKCVNNLKLVEIHVCKEQLQVDVLAVDPHIASCSFGWDVMDYQQLRMDVFASCHLLYGEIHRPSSFHRGQNL